ncbi:MAG: glycolate oxidase subunit GlcF [Gammaproteobacteria bacterium]|jgi:glycolate oxidase iron-sulfur subunit|nr:glycolate oxidase subunit GlcF [Gammaproteobacteria bacterium]MDH3864632.1 glycolate oxidase subunit GlcF [Gammaproteobacteria bacterium]NCF60332.1 glycolate oxidase subunit GlcF [Gammaproteobacteria bacterium]
MYLKLHSDYEGDALAHEAAAIIKSCVHCGFCNATCPTYQEFFDERDGPRGRIYLVKHMLESGQAGDATRMHLDRCLTCRACETTCPSGVRYGRLADIGREIIEEKTQRPVIERLQRLFARKVFPHPGRVRMLLRLGRLVQWFLPSQLRRQIPPKQKLSAPAGKQSSSQRKMIVLKGCVQAEATPRTNDAARRVLQRLGIDLLEAASAGCCGALSYHLAARDEGLDFMRRNIDAWWPLVEAGAEAIVSTASACGVMISDYGEQLKDDPAYSTKARRVSELAKDLTEVLEAEDLSVFRNSTGKQATAVHCPCTLSHGQKRDGSLERVLERSGIPLVESAEKHLCCGSAGTYSLLQPAISQRLLDRKLAALSAGKPEQIVTANIGCQLHLGSRSDVPVKHWIELLDNPN